MIAVAIGAAENAIQNSNARPVLFAAKRLFLLARFGAIPLYLYPVEDLRFLFPCSSLRALERLLWEQMRQAGFTINSISVRPLDTVRLTTCTKSALFLQSAYGAVW